MPDPTDTRAKVKIDAQVSERTLAEIVADARVAAPGWRSRDLERLLAVAEAAEEHANVVCLYGAASVDAMASFNGLVRAVQGAT